MPVTPYSVLTERLPMPLPMEPVPSTSSHVPTNPIIQELLHNNNLNAQSPLQNVQAQEMGINNSDYAIDCNAVVMNSTLAPSVVPYLDTEVNESISEDTQLLPNKQKIPVEAVVVKELTSHGADLGLKWSHLVCCILVLGVVIPLVYVLFYLHKPDEHFNNV